ncbi:hypothetical protein [Dokdonella sp.]|uniref:hypothetical protein n=1 Tax=Dokdonella sp. TaxID=2291710 RepID=UPI002F41AF88
MRHILPLLFALAGLAGSACAADAPGGAPDRAARRAEMEQRFLDRVDANHDGTVSRAEYATWVDARFARLDGNGDGRVDADEIARSPETAERVRKRAVRFVNRYDSSGSGSVSKADFEAKAMARFDRVAGGADTVEAGRLLPRRGLPGRRGGGAADGDGG